MENLSHFQTESEWIFWKIRNSCLYAVDGTHSIHRGCGIYVWKVHTPPVSPSSYNVKPSIWRYPWKRSLFTHDDRLPSSYSATRRQNLSAAHRQSGHKASASKRQAELSADGGVVKVSRFGTSKRSWKWSAGGAQARGSDKQPSDIVQGEGCLSPNGSAMLPVGERRLGINADTNKHK